MYNRLYPPVIAVDELVIVLDALFGVWYNRENTEGSQMNILLCTHPHIHEQTH